MMMFHPEIAYSEAQRRGIAQQRVLDALLSRAQPEGAEALLEQAGL
jgi:hypothetical protein